MVNCNILEAIYVYYFDEKMHVMTKKAHLISFLSTDSKEMVQLN